MNWSPVNWGSAEAFFAMGGYGFYVWSAYAVTAVCLVGESLLVAKRHRDARRQVGVSHEEGNP